MKQFIFITASISNMGGAQMYIRNKVLYLQEKGWNVSVMPSFASNVVIPELQKYTKVFPELDFYPICFGKNKRRRVLKSMLSSIEYSVDDDIVIESTCISQSLWAESLAFILKARHIIYLLQEHNNISNHTVQDYFIFKHSRKELVGISKASLPALFAPFHPISEEQAYRLSADCNNVVSDFEIPILNNIYNSKCDYTIGLLSRLDKPYFMYALHDILKYVKLHSEQTFNLVLIGDAPGDKFRSTITNLTNSEKNLNVIITGYLYPIPSRLLEMNDVLISTSGSSWVCEASGVPTITYDGNDYRPIGILLRTTTSSLFRSENEKEVLLERLLDDILVSKTYTKIQPHYNSLLPDFSSHMDFLSALNLDEEYYQCERFKLETINDFKIRIGLALLGPVYYTKLSRAVTKGIS